MSERIRSVSITVEIDTNKRTLTQTFEQRDDESLLELFARARSNAYAAVDLDEPDEAVAQT